MKREQSDIFERVTNLIVEAIEQGAGSYRMPWRTSGGFPNSPINAASRKPYRGVNVLLLWATAEAKSYGSGLWATYKQWQQLGAQVRKGEQSTHVVFWKCFKAENGEEEDGSNHPSKRIPMARDYWVFNSAQVEDYDGKNEPQQPEHERVERAEALFRSLEVDIRNGGNSAYYSADRDAVFMPAFEAFPDPLPYYSVLSHETTHWSAAANRLNRDLTGRFGSESYAMEELIAELGAAFLCAELGLPTDPRTDHAPYIASWLKTLKNDKRAIFTAAAKAQEAADWLMGRRDDN